MVTCNQDSLLNTCSSECVKIPPPQTLTNTTTASDIAAVCSVYISSAQRQSQSLCSFACSSLSLWVEGQAHTALSSQPLKQGEEGRAVGRMFKDVFHFRLSKGKNAVWSCWCKGTVDNCVFLYSCVEQVQFSADEGPLFSVKDCYRDVFRCLSDASSFISEPPFQSDCWKDILCWSCLSIQQRTDWLYSIMNHKNTMKGFFFQIFPPWQRIQWVNTKNPLTMAMCCMYLLSLFAFNR